MDKDTLISIIVPVYNKEKYLDRSINSILNQTWKNLEIVVINDGSTDNSLQILENMQSKDSRIKIYSQENSGLSYAVYRGIDKANGDYICFVDPDDDVGPNFVKNFCDNIEDADFIAMEINVFNKEKKSNIKLNKNCKLDRKQLIDYREEYIYNRNSENGVNLFDVSRCNKMFRSNLLKKISNDLKIYKHINMGEDTLFTLLLLAKVNSAIALNIPNEYYYYLDNMDSMTNLMNYDKYNKEIIKTYNQLKKFSIRYDFALNQPSLYYYYAMRDYLFKLLKFNKYKEWAKYRAILWKDPIFQEAIKNYPDLEPAYHNMFARILTPQLYFKLIAKMFKFNR